MPPNPRFDKVLGTVILTAPSMSLSRSSYRWLKSGLSVGLILLLLAIAPFAVAQDVHHELASADTDGHQHSDTDLCQWVQHHTSGSIDLGGPIFSAWEAVGLSEIPALSILLSVEFPSVGPSRAPPQI
jgi:hypothetical protein